MKKLLIVDDERIEREGIKMLLKSTDYDIEIVEASNGKVASQILLEQDIDLLLTDIKMPFMSGIDLVKEARKKKPDLPIAIFSGFGEFTYAQEAIKYGVTDYILKPVKPQEFHRTIAKMMEVCRKKELQEEENQSHKCFKCKYLLQKYLLTGNTEYKSALLKESEDSDEKYSLKNIQNMMLLDTEENFFEEHSTALVSLLKKKMGRKIDTLDWDTNQILLFFYPSATDNYERIAGVIHDLILEEYGVRCYIAVSRKIRSIDEYLEAYQELESQMENKFYCSGQWIFLNEASGESDAQGEIIIDYYKKLKENIRLKDVSHLWGNYQKLKEKIFSCASESQIYVKFIFSELVKDLYEEMQGVGSPQMKEAVETIYLAPNVRTIYMAAEKCIREFEAHSIQAESGARSDVDQVKQYIMYHVKEDLSIDKLAAMVYLSQGYLSYIFKKETGMNLSRYIKQCRMEKAKALLKETNMKIVQICEEVGFSNVSYFCQSFREYCGISPDRYRKGEGKDEGEISESEIS